MGSPLMPNWIDEEIETALGLTPKIAGNAVCDRLAHGDNGKPVTFRFVCKGIIADEHTINALHRLVPAGLARMIMLEMQRRHKEVPDPLVAEALAHLRRLVKEAVAGKETQK